MFINQGLIIYFKVKNHYKIYKFIQNRLEKNLLIKIIFFNKLIIDVLILGAKFAPISSLIDILELVITGLN